MQPSSVSIALAGSGGSGVMTTGELLLDAVARDGGYGLLTRSFGPQIRGGESAALLRLSGAPVANPGDIFDLLVALDWQNVDRFADEIPLGPSSVVIADPDQGEVPESIRASGARIVPVPLKALAAEADKSRANMVALGLVATLAGIGDTALRAAIDRRLTVKGDAVLATAHATVAIGTRTADQVRDLPRFNVSGRDGERWNISGNEAAGLGAALGGVRFAAGYPITPSTDILEWLADALPRIGGTLVQAEDELAAVNMCLGAGFGGIPALTATSGPGFSLMVEALGLGVASETPLVVIDVMRGGPSTGIPTKSEQGDLNLAVYGAHGDAPHIVLAPTDIGDCLATTQWAVQLAESLQAPVVILSDQRLGQSRAVIEAPTAKPAITPSQPTEPKEDHSYLRYALTDDGVSPRSLPGTPRGAYVADGLEHDELGRPSTRTGDHHAQLDKRLRKLTRFDYGARWADIEGDGPLAVITWGSTSSPVREALDRLRAEGLAVRQISVRLIAPARTEEMAATLANASAVLVIEQNHAGQFHRHLRAHYDIGPPVTVYHRPGPLPLRPGEICEQIRLWASSEAWETA